MTYLKSSFVTAIASQAHPVHSNVKYSDPCSVKDGIDPVVFLRLVASRHAGSTIPVLSEVYREHPRFAEGNFIADMLGLITRMHLVTGTAGPSFFPVHVQKMQVPVTVAKAGQIRCKPFGGNITVVAIEANSVVFGGIGNVEFCGKRFIEDKSEI
jgi:hypothetical protein